jgi:hypothetical protein
MMTTTTVMTATVTTVMTEMMTATKIHARSAAVVARSATVVARSAVITGPDPAITVPCPPTDQIHLFGQLMSSDGDTQPTSSGQRHCVNPRTCKRSGTRKCRDGGCC